MPTPDGKRARITLMDVARAAGVSRATASLVLRKSPLVRPETRRRVEHAIESLGYVYNLNAARMRATGSRTVGLIVPNLTNPFFAEMLGGIEARLEESDRVVIVANSRESPALQAIQVRRMREHGVDGLIVCPATGTDERLLEDAAKWGLPLVQALRWISDRAGDYAGTDYAGGMRQAVAHLASLGHRDIAFVAGTRVHSASSERLAGFRTGMASHGLADDRILVIPLDYEHAIAAARTLLEQAHPSGRPLTAAICFNDVVGLGLTSGFFDLGIEVGRDFSVIGFDNVPEAAIVRPGLTSVSTHPQAIGEAAADLLLDRLANPARAARRVINLTELVVRQSSGPAPDGVPRLTPARVSG